MCATSTPGREYWYLNHIGTGAASSVVKAAWTPPHQRFMQCQPADASWYTISDTQKAPRSVAIKIFDRPPSDVPNRRYAQNIRDEFDFMQQLSHPNIVQTYELIESGGRFFGVLELCTQSLMSFMGNIEPEQGLVDTIWGSIVEAVRFMHSRGVAHRDIKVENVMICAGTAPKLADLGSAVRFRDRRGKPVVTKDVEGTPPYLAPELYAQPLRLNFADAADIWALGILYTVLTLARFPWEEAVVEDEGYRAFVQNPEALFNELPKSGRAMMRRLLEVDVVKRASWEEMNRNEWARQLLL